VYYNLSVTSITGTGLQTDAKSTKVEQNLQGELFFG